MTAELLASNDLIPLRTSDTGSEALSLMQEFEVRHLPVVNDKQLLALLSEDDILNYDVEDAVGTYDLSLRTPFVKVYDHIYEVMRVMADHQLTLIPVVGADMDYQGYISMEDLLRYFAKTAAFAEPGSIIVLEMTKRDYSLSGIARIVESEDTHILSSFVTSTPDSPKLDVTLKVNRLHIQSLLATLHRFEYVVKASFNEADYFDTLQERYDSLMSYLNV